MSHNYLLLLICVLYQLPSSSGQSLDSLTDALYAQADTFVQQDENESAMEQLEEAMRLIQNESLTRNQVIRFYEKAINQAEAIFQKTKNEDYLKRAFKWTEECKNLLINHLRKKINIEKANDKIVQLEDLRSKILKDSITLLEYLIGEKDVFLFKITKNNIDLFKIRRNVLLEKKVKKLVQMVNVPSENVKEFSEVAYELYTYLLPISPLKKCIIVPDGILHYLPFEVLLTEKPTTPNFKTLPYLLRQTSISYAYSATDLKRHYKGLPINIGKQFLGIAYPDQDSREEVSHLKRKLKGDVLIDSENARLNFEENVDDYDILHLALVGRMSDESPKESGLYLSDNEEFIKTTALHKQEMDASMIVLNSCANDMEQASTGEGIIALTQALSEDSESVISAHWTTDKTASKDLMNRFYSHLSDKQPKGDALRQAKLDYLSENYVNSKTAHPYYWASYMAYNNMLPLEIQILIEDFVWSAVVLILVLLAIGYIMLRKKSDAIPVGSMSSVR